MTSETPVYLIFGAYGGIGSALTRALASEGRVAISGRDDARLQALAAETGATPFLADATDPAGVDQVVTGVLDAFGRIDGVSNCVGSVLLKPAHLTRPEEFEQTVATNLVSSFTILRAVARPMMKQKSGSVVFCSTAAARIGLPNHEAIAAAKAGVDGLVRSAAATYGRAGIRVNSVAPGLVATPLTERITSNEKALESSVAMHAMGRHGQPEEVAQAIRWLLSPQNGWVTGQTLGVDGGLGSVRAG
jgi:NAD(P)-dependent dehydrogenase (short-subunit alcohol dehydrogenase family)